MIFGDKLKSITKESQEKLLGEKLEHLKLSVMAKCEQQAKQGHNNIAISLSDQHPLVLKSLIDFLKDEGLIVCYEENKKAAYVSW